MDEQKTATEEKARNDSADIILISDEEDSHEDTDI